MDETTVNKVEEIYEKAHEIHVKLFEIWLEHMLFTPKWWLLLSLIIIPWTLWFIYRKKESTHRLLFAGMFSTIAAVMLDIMGVVTGLWYYKIKDIPLVSNMITWNFSLIPVSVMFSLQFKPFHNPYIKAFIYSALTSFVAEPLFMWMGFFGYKHWKYIYSFPIYFVIYLIAHYMSKGNKFEKL